MTPTESGDRRASLKANLLERLHDPLQLRICVMAIVLVAGYVAVYQPLSEKIDETTKRLNRERDMLDLAGSIEKLQGQYHNFQKRLPQQTDTKEWVQYVLESIRRLPVKMIKLDCRPQRRLGPYPVVVLQIELEGSFFGLDEFLRWLESDHRLLRADDVRLSPTRDPGNMSMQVTLMGMAG